MYCINCTSLCFELVKEKEFIIQLVKDGRLGSIPVILVLTQCYYEDDQEEMMKELKLMEKYVKQMVPVVAEPKIKKKKMVH